MVRDPQEDEAAQADWDDRALRAAPSAMERLTYAYPDLSRFRAELMMAGAGHGRPGHPLDAWERLTHKGGTYQAYEVWHVGVPVLLRVQVLAGKPVSWEVLAQAATTPDELREWLRDAAAHAEAGGAGIETGEARD
jgi:hypothetical protein